MSYLPPKQAGFSEAVQVYFTEATGKMMVFGARDRDLLNQWREQGRPARLVCRGIRKAVESYGRDDPPRRLAQCEPFVDDLWEQFQQRDVGAHNRPQSDTDSDEAGDEPGVSTTDQKQPSGLYQRVRRAIERAGKSADEERWRQAYRRAWRELDEEATADQFSFQQLEAVDEALVDAYLDALDDEERRIVEEALGSTSSGLLKQMSPAAKRQHMLMKRKRALVEQFGLVDLFDVV